MGSYKSEIGFVSARLNRLCLRYYKNTLALTWLLFAKTRIKSSQLAASETNNLTAPCLCPPNIDDL